MTDWAAYAQGFARTRPLDPADVRRWMERVADTAGVAAADLPDLPWLDAGAGNGRFSAGIAEWWRRDVVALELRAPMLAVRGSAPGVWWARGDAQAPPFAQSSFGGVWVHLVLHQIPDWRGAARALAGCVAPGGVMAVRTVDPDARTRPLWRDFFPADEAADAGRWPRPSAIADVMRDAGMQVHSTSYADERESSAEAYIRQVEQKAFSTLLDIPDAAFADGLAKLKAAYPPGSPPIRRTEHSALVVGRR